MATTITGERRIVSVLIADVVNSTGIGERLGPERSKFLMDEVQRIMTAQIRRYDGTVVQRVGDEIFAVFGAPVAHEDDGERAVRAALSLQRAIARYAEEVRDAYGVELAVRVGVHTGPVVVPGDDGKDIAERWNALGDTVNVASRLQELAAPGEVAMGAETARQVEGCFEVEPLGEQELQGKSVPFATFTVRGVRDPERPAPEGPLVGRDFELTVLERAMDGLREGKGVIVSVIGEAGIGKSRLAAEVRAEYGDAIRFVEGRAVSYAQGFPYSPIRDLLRNWLGVGASTPETRVRLELKAQIAALFGDHADDAYPFLANLLGLTLEPDAAEKVRELNRESVQHQTYEVFAELVCHLAGELPLCLVLEDLHWADEGTLAVLQKLLDEPPPGGVLIVLTARPGGRVPTGRALRVLDIAPLAADQNDALLLSLAGGGEPDLADELKRAIPLLAAGNPLVCTQVLNDLAIAGHLRHDELGRPFLDMHGLHGDYVPPDSVWRVLERIVWRLEPAKLEILGAAATIGRHFLVSDLAGLGLFDEAAVRAAVEEAGYHLA